MEMYDKIENVWGYLNDDTKLGMMRDAEAYGYVSSGDSIYDMDDFDEIMGDARPSEVADKMYYGDFNPNHDYFIFDGYGNLESFSGYDLGDRVDEYEVDIVSYIAEKEAWEDYPDLVAELEAEYGDNYEEDDDDEEEEEGEDD